MGAAAGLDYKLCVSCGGLGSQRDLGSGEDRPCCLCRKPDYAAWVAERQPATRRLAMLDEHGRCCGRKPMVYKRPTHRLYCPRCNAEIDPETGRQQENWAWESDGDALGTEQLAYGGGPHLQAFRQPQSGFDRAYAMVRKALGAPVQGDLLDWLSTAAPLPDEGVAPPSEPPRDTSTD